MATISVTNALSLAAKAGFSGNSQKTIVAIAQAESGLDAARTSPPNTDAWHSVDRGIVQINNHWHPEVSDACAYDAQCAFGQAYRISQQGKDFSPWSTYRNGAYLHFFNALGNVGVGGNTSGQRAWYMYGEGLTFGQGDAGIGGEHGIDILDPPDTPITFLVGGTISDISNPVGYGMRVTWKMDQSYRGIPYAYQIHLDAVNPGLSVGKHVNAGDLMGWSGGENSTAQLQGASNPTGTHTIDSAYMSSGPHTEFGFSYGPVYGQGVGFSDIHAHPELNPMTFMDSVRAGNIDLSGGDFSLLSSSSNVGGGGTGTATGYSSANAPAILNAFTDKFSQFSNTAHQTISSTPGFYGACLALDDAEQFPGIYNAFQNDSNPFDAPSNAVMSVLHTIGGNGPPLLIRTMIAGLGLLLLIGLAFKVMEPIGEQAAGIVGPLLAGGA